MVILQVARKKVNPPYTYACRVLRVIDGDTFFGTIDLGFNTLRQDKFRLAHIDAPEIKTPEGEAACVFFSGIVNANDSSFLLKSLGEDKYGRWLCELVLPDGTTVNDKILAANQAVPYEGGKRV
jgi:endonuclease YncB( thermonuclease family)